MNDPLGFATSLILLILAAGVMIGVICVIHLLVSLPLRRAERARLFLDLVESSIQKGQPVEEDILSLARARDLSMGVDFHLLAAHLESGIKLEDALGLVPGFLPSPVNAMLISGQRSGITGKILAVCRQMIGDAKSHVRGALNYIIVLTCVITPATVGIYAILQVFVIPKFNEIFESIGQNQPPYFALILHHQRAAVFIQLFLLLLLWLAVLCYILGPRFAARFPVLQNLQYRLPWRRNRMKRDFSTMLAILLDSDVSEPEAISLAAQCTANRVFICRAALAVERLREGINLPEAVRSMDDSGEFAWRLFNAAHQARSFCRALAGWHESLDAKAFQQEQAAAHLITTGLVLWSGLWVGALVVAVFGLLISIIKEGLLW